MLQGHPDVVAVEPWLGLIAVQHALQAIGSSDLPQQQYGPHQIACTSNHCLRVAVNVPVWAVRSQPAAEHWQLTVKRAAVQAEYSVAPLMHVRLSNQQ